jgi:alpha/beta superfamily hydrolase
MAEQEIFIPGKSGKLQAKLDNSGGDTMLLVCHPHPQFAGTMDNKVVTTVIAAGRHLGMQTLRFNYRGVGLSDGSYGQIAGEVDDASSVLDYLAANINFTRLVVAGFSFGSFIAAKVASEYQAANLVCIAPPIIRMPFTALNAMPKDKLLIQGMADEIVSAGDSLQWAAENNFDCFQLAGVTHFFHGQLRYLRKLLECYWSTTFNDLNENHSHLA